MANKSRDSSSPCTPDVYLPLHLKSGCKTYQHKAIVAFRKHWRRTLKKSYSSYFVIQINKVGLAKPAVLPDLIFRKQGRFLASSSNLKLLGIITEIAHHCIISHFSLTPSVLKTAFCTSRIQSGTTLSKLWVSTTDNCIDFVIRGRVTKRLLPRSTVFRLEKHSALLSCHSARNNAWWTIKLTVKRV